MIYFQMVIKYLAQMKLFIFYFLFLLFFVVISFLWMCLLVWLLEMLLPSWGSFWTKIELIWPLGLTFRAWTSGWPYGETYKSEAEQIKARYQMKLVSNMRINYGLFYLLKCSGKRSESCDRSTLNIRIVNSGMLISTK